MRSIITTLIIGPALVFAAACSKDKTPDPALANDLTLAAQARQTATLDSISALERARTERARVASTGGSTARGSSGGTHRGSSSDGSVATSSGRTVTDKNTKRDAAIGAAAGAIIGGASSRSVKGGIIGAAAGAILGGVVGNNVDIKKKKVP
ncbi:MAG: YMGG-like glycine zipper-containing protein [bacterium]